jgi:chorismate dehydratase
VRVSAVSYLNSRPLVYGLDRRPDRFAVQYDVPSVCAARLHEGTVDLGLIPAIEYLSRERYRIVPGVAVASRGPVASVCLFSRSPIEQVRRIALDTSSRTSAALVRILCARHFGIDPEFVPHPPDLDAMLSNSDAALLIGDLALQLNRAARERWNPENPQNPETPESRHAGTEPRNPGTQEPRNLEVLDLGEAWTSMTGLPFVWAFWVGPEGALDASHVAALQVARDCGVTSVDDVAAAFSAEPAERRRAAAYLRENIRFWLGSAELEGLRQYYRHAAELGLVAAARDPAFF